MAEQLTVFTSGDRFAVMSDTGFVEVFTVNSNGELIKDGP